VNGPCKSIARNGAEPSALATQMALVPERSDRNAMRLPSGEYCGSVSYLVEAIKGWAASWPSTGARHIAIFVNWLTYARRSPRRAIAGCKALCSAPTIRTGFPPESERRHKPICDLFHQLAETMMLRPSADQAKLSMGRFSKLSRAGDRVTTA